MSACYVYKCGNCGFAISAWDEGDRFIIDDVGNRHFFYHPGEERMMEEALAKCGWAKGKTRKELDPGELSRHIGRLDEMVCRDCGVVSKIDAADRSPKCPACNGKRMIHVLKMGQKQCPKCKKGRLPKHPYMDAIS